MRNGRRRWWTCLAASAAALAAWALPATLGQGAAGLREDRPACGDVVPLNDFGTSDAIYDNVNEQLLARMALREPPCPDLTYTLLVYDEAGDAEPLVTSSAAVLEPELSAVSWQVSTAGNADEQVCVSVVVTESQVKANKVKTRVVDEAPDAGCIVIRFDDLGAGRGFL